MINNLDPPHWIVDPIPALDSGCDLRSWLRGGGFFLPPADGLCDLQANDAEKRLLMWDEWRGQLWLDCCCRFHIIPTGCTKVWLKKHNLLKVKLEMAHKPGFIAWKAQVIAVLILCLCTVVFWYVFYHLDFAASLHANMRAVTLSTCRIRLIDSSWPAVARWLELHDTFFFFFLLRGKNS